MHYFNILPFFLKYSANNLRNRSRVISPYTTESYGKRTIKKTRTIRMIVVMEVEYAYEKEQPYTLEEKT
jgi:hypothetical protein